MLDDVLAPVPEGDEPRGELVGVDRAAGGDADRVGVVRRALLQQRADARDDDPGAFGAQAPADLEAPAHRLDARADALEREGLPGGEHHGVVLAEEGREVVAQGRGVGAARHDREEQLPVEPLAQPRDRERPRVVGDGHGGVARPEGVPEGAVVRERAGERRERRGRHGRPTGR